MTFYIILLIPLAIIAHNGVSASVTKVVQREGLQTTMTCSLPPDDGWSECKFQHHDGSQGKCSVFNRDGGMFQNCGAFGQAEIVADGEVCQLVLATVSNDHNGTWSCDFTEGKRKKGHHWYPNSLANYTKKFTLAILHEPSSITVNPQAGSVHGYYLMDWIEASVSVENVAPMPTIQWTIENESINGTSIKETEVSYLYQDLEVTESLHFKGQETFSGKRLQYRLTLEVVDENGTTSEDYVNEGSIRLICNDCPPPHSSTTSQSSTLSTTHQTTSTTPPTTPPTTPLTTPTSTTPPTTPPTTPLTTPTTTTPPSTLPTSPTITSTVQVPVDCYFNLTNMSGPLKFPPPQTICNLDSSPTWTININCNGNCINIININISKMVYKNNSDPCDTTLKLTTYTGNGDRVICFDEALPLELAFKERQVSLQFENLGDDSQVSFEGEYYFSE